MSTHILGISAFYHDSAACLLRDGEVVAAVQEERFTRKKHDPGFPKQAVAHCLDVAGIQVEDLDWVGFYDKPLLTFDRLIESYVGTAPKGFASFTKFLPKWLGEKLHLPRIIRRELGGTPKNPLVFTEHHESHAASAFFPSPFEDAAILTMDGVGEWATTSIGVGEGHKIRLTHEIRFPHSLGLLYSAFTYYCGFRVNSGEYKLMGLAPYGEPKYTQQILDHLIDLKDDGSYRLDMSYFDYISGLRMTSKKFDQLFGAPARSPESELEQRHMDLAASVQKVTEEVMLRTTRFAREATGKKNLCLAGGVALNCVGNGRVLREGPFDRVWIQPAAGDAGGALGVAQFVWHQLLGNERAVSAPDGQQASLLGPAYGDREIERALDDRGLVYERHDDEGAFADRVAELLGSENVVGWFQGRMEFGPRALGARSIIGDARSPKMQSVMNLKIKFRESFRPFAPIVLRDRAHEYFTIREDQDSPYMLIVAPVREEKRLDVDPSAQGFDRLHQIRSVVPAITHVDYSARLQTVDDGRHPRLAKVMRTFESKTGSPVLINTSFNVRGEPIVCTPDDAARCFLGTEMDVLVLDRYVVVRKDQTVDTNVDKNKYASSFALD